MRCELRGCADSARVSDPLPTGASRSHNPLVLGSNPSGPTSQPIEMPVVRKNSATTCQGLMGRLKLFSQLFEADFLLFRHRQNAESVGVILPRLERSVFQTLGFSISLRGQRTDLAKKGLLN
jgi:hypothetical protein